MPPSREAEIAWAAGLFEGEGCLLVHKSRHRGTQYRRARAGLVSTDEDVVRRFQAIVGVGKVYGPYRGGKTPHGGIAKPQWNWYVTDREGFARFAELVGPWLCSRRRAKLADVLRITPTRHRGQKLSDDDVRAIRRSDEPNRILALRYSVHRGYIGQIKRGIEPNRVVA